MIVEYHKKYDEDIKNLLVELQQHIQSIDVEGYNILTNEYRKLYFQKTLDEANKFNGNILLYKEDEKIVGLVIGLLNNEEEKYDFKVPKRGLWTREDREKTVKYYKDRDIECEIHYVSVDEETWKQNIAERNKRVEEGNGGSDFYLDEGLMKKLESFWEEPSEYEVDVIYKVTR